MKTLTERTEIASAINFKQYPVVTIDVSKRDDYGIVGCPVCVDAGLSFSLVPAQLQEQFVAIHSICKKVFGVEA